MRPLAMSEGLQRTRGCDVRAMEPVAAMTKEKSQGPMDGHLQAQLSLGILEQIGIDEMKRSWTDGGN